MYILARIYSLSNPFPKDGLGKILKNTGFAGDVQMYNTDHNSKTEMTSAYNGNYYSSNAIFVPGTKRNFTIPIWVSTREKKYYPSAASPKM